MTAGPGLCRARAQGTLKDATHRPSRAGSSTDTSAMPSIERPWRSSVRPAILVVGSLVAVSLAVAILEGAGLEDGSSVYLLAVVTTSVLAGAWPALVTALGAFLIYDLLFVEPRYTLTVENPQEWLNLLLLLIVGLVVGRLAGLERDRAVTAVAREREASAMARISFALASTTGAAAAFEAILSILTDAVGASRAWIRIGERTAADTGSGPPPAPAVQHHLRREPGDRPARWARVHVPSSARPGGSRDATSVYRVAITAGDATFGSLSFERARPAGDPDGGATRVAAAAADQIGRAMDRDRLAADAAAAEVGRRSDALKSALLDSVSHDLRTPLASIRAAAGTLMEPDVQRDDDQRRAIAAAIDQEADRLDRLVSNLLDLSRIEAGGLRPSRAAFVLEDLVGSVVGRSSLRDRPNLTIDIPAELPLVEVDDVLFEQVLGNLLENADRYAGPDAAIRLGARAADATVVLTVEDGGLGVDDAAMPRLFEKFYRAPRADAGSRRGTGTGLAVVLGLVRSMGGSVRARRSPMGGLAVDVTLRSVQGPPPEAMAGVERPA